MKQLHRLPAVSCTPHAFVRACGDRCHPDKVHPCCRCQCGAAQCGGYLGTSPADLLLSTRDEDVFAEVCSSKQMIVPCGLHACMALAIHTQQIAAMPSVSKPSLCHSSALLAWLCPVHRLQQFLCQTLHSFGTIALMPLLCKTDSFTLHKAAAFMETSTIYGLVTASALLCASLKPAFDCCCR